MYGRLVLALRKQDPNVSPQRRAAEATMARLKQTLETEAGRGYVTIDHFLNVRGNPSAQGEGGVVMPSTDPGTGFYNVGEIVAMGGMGAIIRATDRNLERTVAMKIMLNSANASETSIVHFIAEAKITGQLEHPNIVPLHDMGVAADGTIYYTMKLIEGTTLREILQEIRAGNREMAMRYPLDRLLEIFQKVCDGMSYAHSRRVVHRDLKPDNIMVGAFGEVLILDWGIAKVLTGAPATDESGGPVQEGIGDMPEAPAGQFATMEGQVKGTPNYMAPEQAEGRISAIDERTDIYAMGGILYTILTLYPPIVGTTVQEILAKVTSGDITAPTVFNQTQTGGKAKAKAGKPEPPLPLLDLIHLPDKKIPPALSAVAMKAMSLDMDQRYQDLNEFQGEIRRYLGGFATSAEDAGAFTQMKLALGRYKKEIAISAVFLILAALIGVYAVGRVILFSKEAEKAKNEAVAKLDELRATAPTFLAAAKASIEDFALTNALDKIETALKFNPTNAEFHLVKGHIHQSLLQMSEAHDAYQKARELAKKRNPTLADLAEKNRALSSTLRGKKLAESDFRMLYNELLAQKRLREANEMNKRAGKMDEAGFESLKAQITRSGLKGEWLSRDVNGNLELNAGGANTTDIAGIRGIQFTTINLANCRNLDNIGPIDITKLESLDLSGTKVTDLSPLRGATKLVTLNLSGTTVADLLPLDKIPLSDLNLSNCPAVVDISKLKDAKLTRLNLSRTQVKELSSLKGHPIAWLNLERSKVQQNELDQLKGNDKLTTLFAADTGVRSIEGLADAPLEIVDLRGTLVSDLNPLKGKSIHTLLLERCRSLKELKPLEGMRSLRLLSLGNTDVQDISALRGLPLSTLRLANTRVTDLSPLVGMPLDQELDLSFTAIADINPLRGIPAQTLLLHRTRVANLDPLSGLAVKTLRLDECDLIVSLLPLGQCTALERLSLPSKLSDKPDIILAVNQLPNLRSLSYTVPVDDWARASTRDAFWKEYDLRYPGKRR